ncbi:MAG: DUF4386 family protein [Anaerolineales bacterium]|jgi:hypothetical protein
MTKTNQENRISQWKSLYKIAGISVLLMISIVPIQIAIFSIVPPPSTALGWFELFQDNALLGLLSFEVLFIVYGALAIPLSLALYAALRRTDPALMALYLALTIAGSAALFSARPALEMLHLSHQFAAATTEAQRVMYLSAGEGLLAIFHGTSYMVSYLLGSITGLILSIVMLRSQIFSRATAYVRIVSSVFDLGLFLPVVGMYVSAFSAVLLFVWNIMIARRIFQLGKSTPAGPSLPA